MKKKLVFVKLLSLAMLLVCVAVLCLSGCNDVTTEQEVPIYRQLPDHTLKAEYREDWEPTKDQAIIFIPGMMASAFFTLEHEPFWGFTGFGNIARWVGTKGKDQVVSIMTDLLSCDADCNPLSKIRIANMDDGIYKCNFDAFSGMSYTYNYIKEKGYDSEYDMLCWQYDWRQSIVGAGYQLQRFINDCGYEKLIFVTHSMGGVVVSDYLSISEENRNKVQLFIPYSAPLLGSMDTYNQFFPKDDSLKASGLDDIIGLLLGVIPEFDMTAIAKSVASVYQMMPNEHYSEGEEYKNYLTVDGVAKGHSESISFLSNFDWAKGSDGNVKKCLQYVEEYQKSYYIDGKHVTQLVPTEYVVGYGIDTLVSINVKSSTMTIDQCRFSNGDGTVSTFSGSAGLYNGTGEIPANVHVEYNVKHGPIANSPGAFDPGPKTFYSTLDSIFERFEQGIAGTN